MRHSSILLLLLLVFASVAVAQGVKAPNSAPNFSGRWVSESVKMQTDLRPQMRTDQDIEIELVVVQSADELELKEMTITRRGKHSRDAVYYLDGRGESNEGFTDGFIYESKTKINNQKLHIEGAVRFPNSQGSSYQTEEWELSADGKTLTIKTKTVGRSVIRYEKVFRLAL